MPAAVHLIMALRRKSWSVKSGSAAARLDGRSYLEQLCENFKAEYEARWCGYAVGELKVARVRSYVDGQARRGFPATFWVPHLPWLRVYLTTGNTCSRCLAPRPSGSYLHFAIPAVVCLVSYGRMCNADYPHVQQHPSGSRRVLVIPEAS